MFRVIFGCCNIGVPYTFWESPGSIKKRVCIWFSLQMTALPYLRLKHAVLHPPFPSYLPYITDEPSLGIGDDDGGGSNYGKTQRP